MIRRTLLLSALIFPATFAVAEEISKEHMEFFESKIRPILAENCYKCHNAEKGKSKGGLTLDSKEGAYKGGDTGAAVVPGDLEKSLMYKAILSEDKDVQMPPRSSSEKLSDDKIKDIAKWIEMGAPYPAKAAGAKLTGLTDKARSHWAYQPVKKAATPTNKNQQWCRTPIDAFILQKLEAAYMLPSPDADKETLLRRAYYDLIGLPPSPQDVEVFLADNTPKAFEKVVDRLLMSPQYGERWARYWLDSARYSDTSGVSDGNRTLDYRYANAWTYRDYVIRSLNEDKPYDVFIKEQLAADFLYPMSAKTAGAAPAAAAQPAMMGGEMAPTMAPAMNASTAPAMNAMTPAMNAKPAEKTMGMAEEGMMMMGGMKGQSGAQQTAFTGEVHPNLAALGFLTVGKRFPNPNDVIDDRIDAITKGFLAMTVSCARCHDHMFDPVSQKDYYALHGVLSSINEPVESSRQPVIARKDAKQAEDYKQKLTQLERDNREVYWQRLDYWLSLLHSKPDKYLRIMVMGFSQNPDVILSRDELIKTHELDGVWAAYMSQNMMNEGHGVLGPLRKLTNIKPEEFEAKAPEVLKQITNPEARYNKLVVNALVEAKPATMDAVLGIYTRVFEKVGAKWPVFIQNFMQNDAALNKISAKIESEEFEILRGPFDITHANSADTAWLRNATQPWFASMKGQSRFIFPMLNELDLTHPGAPSRAMVVTEKPQPVNSPVFIRGEARSPGEVVPRRFLEIFPGGAKPFTKGSGRLELAEAIASKSNPLTARVMVNRVWMHHFGEGFVRTPDDLGVMSEAPSHPELIDWLSSYFMETNWSLKRLHKAIMMSRVYQASSHTRVEYETKDPENRLLWRANVRRLDFEAIRDSLLSFSGQLDVRLGGQPVNITEEPYSLRRSVYGYIDRGNLPELMSHFDFSNPDMPNSKRTTTVVPQQALFLMNSSMSVDVARRIVARPEFARADNNLRRIFALYRIIYQRQPKPAEIQTALAFLESEGRKQSEVQDQAWGMKKKNELNAKRIAARDSRTNDGESAIQNEGEIVERKILTPWETYTQALLLANEAAYVN